MKKLEKNHPSANWSDFRSRLISGFAGDDSPMILYDCLLHNDIFLHPWKYPSAATTRARCGMIVVGNHDAILRSKHARPTKINEVIKDAKKLGQVFGVTADELRERYTPYLPYDPVETNGGSVAADRPASEAGPANE